jgi:hypothetical protein
MDKKHIYDQGIGRLIETKSKVNEMHVDLSRERPNLVLIEIECKELMAKIALD